MGWLGGFLKRVSGAAPEEMLFAPSVAAPALPGIGEPIVADECYVELFVESLRLTEARRFASRFNGVVYSFVTLAREGEANAQLAAVSKPDKLTEIDDTSLDKVITVSKQMMAAVPWRGGALSLEIGLFSVKAGNLLSPILDYVTRVSSAAGISFVGAVKPFLPLITEGMALIAGQRADTAVEVALDTDLALGQSAVMAIVAAPRGSIDVAKLSLDADRRLLLDGRSLDRGYCVFSIRRAAQKADFGEIPELKEKYATLQAAIRANKAADARDAMTAFRLATIASPDLISSDARRLVEKAQQKLDAAFVSTEGVGTRAGLEARPVETLADIGLYP